MSWQIRDLSQDLCNGIQTENRQRNTQQGILLDKLNGRRFYIFNDIFNFLYRFAHQRENLQIHTLEMTSIFYVGIKNSIGVSFCCPCELKLNCIGELLFWVNELGESIGQWIERLYVKVIAILNSRSSVEK